jgi:hypothetical protein
MATRLRGCTVDRAPERRDRAVIIARGLMGQTEVDLRAK